MRRLLFAVLFLTLSAAAFAATGDAGWPTLKAQIQKAEAPAGSALEKLIRANQDFSLLRAEEAYDKIRIPLWLRVNWRKAHPEGTYLGDRSDRRLSAGAQGGRGVDGDSTPTCGPGRPEPDIAPRPVKTSGGTNLRVSGAPTVLAQRVGHPGQLLEPARRSSAPRTTSAAAASRPSTTRPTAAPPGGRPASPLQTGDAFHSDPTVDWTSDGTAWSTTIGINSAGTTLKMRAYQSTNGGATWTFDDTFSGAQTNTDKQMMWVDHSATSAFKDNIYASWHNGNPAVRQPPHRPGAALAARRSRSAAPRPPARHRLRRQDQLRRRRLRLLARHRQPQDLAVAKSTNGGVSYGAPVTRSPPPSTPSTSACRRSTAARLLIYVSGGAYRTATKNNVYAVWTDLSGATGCTTATNEPGANATSTCKTRIWFARSTDGGATWAAPVMINNQASLNDQFNPWLAVDETNGQIAVMYYDTVGRLRRARRPTSTTRPPSTTARPGARRSR